MKTWSLAILFVSTTFVAATSFAAEEARSQTEATPPQAGVAPAQASQLDEAQTHPLVEDIPTEEKAFVEAINKYDKAKILAQFGEPAKAEDVKIKGSEKVVASIWHYHNLNTAEDGTYYPITELDFIDDKVVQVVFLNHSNLDDADNGKAYELPADEPYQIEPTL